MAQVSYSGTVGDYTYNANFTDNQPFFTGDLSLPLFTATSSYDSTEMTGPDIEGASTTNADSQGGYFCQHLLSDGTQCARSFPQPGLLKYHPRLCTFLVNL